MPGVGQCKWYTVGGIAVKEAAGRGVFPFAGKATADSPAGNDRKKKQGKS